MNETMNVAAAGAASPMTASFSMGAAQQPGNYTLQLLHMSDGEAGLLADDTAPIMGALIDRFDGEFANTLILSGGDNYIPGPFLNAGADPSLNAVIGATAAARPDIAIHNAFGVEVSAIGNHEFDLGSPVFAGAIAPSGDWAGALFPHVSANLDFSADGSLNPLITAGGQEAAGINGLIAPSAIVTKGGEQIGLVGATTQVLERISSPNGTEVAGFPTAGEAGDNEEVDDMALLAEQLQPVIDGLIANGVDKIVVMSHLQDLDNERELAGLLTGVDIILGAGSNTRLGDGTPPPAAFPGHEANFADTYPIQTVGADGNPVLIVNTDNEYTYLGRLVVEFDAAGNITAESLAAFGEINGAYASTQTNLEAAYGSDIGLAFAEGSKGAEVQAITEAVDAVISAKDGDVAGFTDVYLEGERSFIRSQETNLGNLAADSQAFAAREAVGDDTLLVSLKNGGGIRAQIGAIDVESGAKIPPVANDDADKPEGAVSALDIENALRFDNKLMVFDTTPEGLLAILNHGVAAGAGQGRFPQLGGVEFSWDPSLPEGERVRDVAVIGDNGELLAAIVDDGEVVEGAPETISVVTLSFLAGGGDSYPIPANGTNFRFLLEDGTLSEPVEDPATAAVPEEALGEQAAFANFLAEFHATAETAFNEADTPEAEDERIQNVSVREDTVLEDFVPGEPEPEPEPEPLPEGVFVLDGGDDVVDAGDMIDTVVLAAARSAVTLVPQDDGSVVLGYANGSARLTGVELLQTSDGTILLSPPAPAGFDEGAYLQLNPDVAAAVAAGVFASGADHFAQFGAAEGRIGVVPFDEAFYLEANADVAGAVGAGVVASGLQHFLSFGAAEGRDPVPLFDSDFYLAENVDVSAIVATGETTAYEHYLQFGGEEGRAASEFFDTEGYYAENPDVAAAGLNPLVHLYQFGVGEGRFLGTTEFEIA